LIVTYLYERNLKGKHMKNILAENLLRFSPKNLTESEKKNLSKLTEQTNIEDAVQSLGQLNVSVQPYQTIQLTGNGTYTAYKRMASGGQQFYKVFVTDQSIVANNGTNKFVIGKAGQISWAGESKQNWKFTAESKPVQGVFVANDNVPGYGINRMETSIDISTKDMPVFVVNPTSPALNNLITSVFIQNKADYNFTFKQVGGYNESKHKNALIGAINCIEKGNEFGLFNIAVPTVDILKVL
jgi:hypothetical protein